MPTTTQYISSSSNDSMRKKGLLLLLFLLLLPLLLLSSRTMMVESTFRVLLCVLRMRSLPSASQGKKKGCFDKEKGCEGTSGGNGGWGGNREMQSLRTFAALVARACPDHQSCTSQRRERERRKNGCT